MFAIPPILPMVLPGSTQPLMQYNYHYIALNRIQISVLVVGQAPRPI